jgi:hypothetical protein
VPLLKLTESIERIAIEDAGLVGDARVDRLGVLDERAGFLVQARRHERPVPARDEHFLELDPGHEAYVGVLGRLYGADLESGSGDKQSGVGPAVADDSAERMHDILWYRCHPSLALDGDHVRRTAVIVGPHIDVDIAARELDVLLDFHLVATLGEDAADHGLKLRPRSR